MREGGEFEGQRKEKAENDDKESALRRRISMKKAGWGYEQNRRLQTKKH